MAMNFTLTLLSDERMILSTERMLSPEEVAHIQEVFEEWRNTPQGLLVMAGCVVGHAVDVDLENIGDA